MSPLSGKGPVRSSSTMGETTRTVKATFACHRNQESDRGGGKVIRFAGSAGDTGSE